MASTLLIVVAMCDPRVCDASERPAPYPSLLWRHREGVSMNSVRGNLPTAKSH